MADDSIHSYGCLPIPYRSTNRLTRRCAVDSAAAAAAAYIEHCTDDIACMIIKTYILSLTALLLLLHCTAFTVQCTVDENLARSTADWFVCRSGRPHVGVLLGSQCSSSLMPKTELQ